MVSSRTASAPPQKKCKKKGLPHYFNATAPFLLSRRRPSAEKARRFGAKGTKEQGFAGVRAPTPGRKIGKGDPDTGRVGAPLPAKPYASVTGRQHLALAQQPAAKKQ